MLAAPGGGKLLLPLSRMARFQGLIYLSESSSRGSVFLKLDVLKPSLVKALGGEVTALPIVTWPGSK